MPRCCTPHLKTDFDGSWMVSTMRFRLLILQRWILKSLETVQTEESAVLQFLPSMKKKSAKGFCQLLLLASLIYVQNSMPNLRITGNVGRLIGLRLSCCGEISFPVVYCYSDEYKFVCWVFGNSGTYCRNIDL